MFAVDRRTKLLTLGAMCFALFMAMLDNTVVNVALPTIQTHFGSGVSGLAWIIDAYTLVFAAFMLTGGTLGDLYGRKRVFLIGLTIFTLGSLAAGLAPSLNALIAARALQGLGAAALLPGTLSILTQTFPDARERAMAIGIWAGVSGMALAAGPIVGGALVDGLGWQSVFFLNIPIGILAFFVAMRIVRESKHAEGRHLDLPGQVLAIVGLGALTYALIEANSYGWTSPTILGLFAGAAVAIGLFLWVELRSSSPMLQLSFFKDRTFAAAATTAALVSFGMFGVFFFLTLFLQNIQGYSALGMGVRALPLTGAIIVTAPLAGPPNGRGSGHHGPRHDPDGTHHARHAVQRALVEPAHARRGHGTRDDADDRRRDGLRAAAARRYGVGHEQRQPGARRRLRDRAARRRGHALVREGPAPLACGAATAGGAQGAHRRSCQPRRRHRSARVAPRP
jgi:EmrB/QacA subfamily drug resistance transporter